jgi:hypothetical protein
MKKRKKLPAQQFELFNKETNMTNLAYVVILCAIAAIVIVGYFYATTHGVIVF